MSALLYAPQHLSICQLVRLRALLDAGGVHDGQEVDPVVARSVAAELEYRKKVSRKVGAMRHG
jgi:hypothetical protein